MPVVRLVPAEDVGEEPYRLKTLKAPVLRGTLLKIFAWFLATPLGTALQVILRRRNGIPQALREVEIPERPTFLPWAFFDPVELLDHISVHSESPKDVVSTVLNALPPPLPTQSTQPATVRDYIQAYTSGQHSMGDQREKGFVGRVTPFQIAQRIVRYAEERPELHWFIAFNREEVLQQGRASAERYAAGEPLSPLDGVPFCVKDVLHALHYATTCGTVHISHRVDQTHRQAPIVTALKDLGGMLLGKTNMHEIGLGVTGLNRNHGTPVNPWRQDCYPGGSSSGAAAVVASGLCPLSVGSDGGGSIRIPSSFCGVFGLKLTYGREIPQCSTPLDYSVCTFGSLTRHVEDGILLYSLLAKQDPPLLIPKLVSTPQPLHGLKFGVYWEWFNDADVEIRDRCRAALTDVEDLGGRIVSVTVPELELLRVAHTTTISSEMRQVMNTYYTEKTSRNKMSLDVLVNLTLASNFTSHEYIQAQCIRTRMGVHFKKVLETVDCLVTPTTPLTAPVIHRKARSSGEHNLPLTSTIMRFMPAANFLGLPSASLPVGLDSEGKPIGLQVMGKHWQESLLLKICFHLQTKLQTDMESRSPLVFYDPLRSDDAVMDT